MVPESKKDKTLADRYQAAQPLLLGKTTAL